MAKISGIVQRIIPSDLRRANSMISGALKSGYKALFMLKKTILQGLEKLIQNLNQQ